MEEVKENTQPDSNAGSNTASAEGLVRVASATEQDNGRLKLPILVAKDLVLFPYMILPVAITDKSSVKLIDDVLSRDKRLGYFLIKEDVGKGDVGETIHPYNLYEFGTLAEVLKMLKLPNGGIQILVQGMARIRLKKIIQRTPYLIAEVEEIPDIPDESSETKALFRSAVSQFMELMKMVPYMPEELQVAVVNISDPVKLAYLIAANLNIPVEERQKLIETSLPREKLKRVNSLINRELQILKLSKKIQTEVEGQIEKIQREHLLREQMRAIQKELGEADEHTIGVIELKDKIEKAKMPKEVQVVALKEVERLSKIPHASPEYTVAHTYVDWLVSLPWAITTTDRIDIRLAKRILDEDHYNLEKVKERILEYLAVRKLKSDIKGPILCFLGPPGVGKTSLGMSIARAMERKFIRLSLGGIRDEAEIRGHRRTYVGALPGRIIQSIKKAESKNPIFMLDEIDKLGADFRGDPSSALLEVLDPEQNHAFLDHYLDVPFDLSKVMFISTANITDTIPPALKDRMEIIELPGYTEEEKIMIAKNFIIPKQLKEHGLISQNLNFDKGAIYKIITSYTREAGLRNLEREIASICRKVAKNIALGKDIKRNISASDISKFLGPEKHFMDFGEKSTAVGIATGLAWTAAGGEVLSIEVTKMPGSKNLMLTGQLGDVMKESAQAALSFIRSRADKYKISDDFFSKSDIHIHIPAGATPKDGPSAGITMTAALYSLLTNKRIKPSTAMTGEITLQGKVLPIGGVKEKILAAKRAGIKNVILPSKNCNDLSELPKEVRKQVKFHFVETIDQMLKLAF